MLRSKGEEKDERKQPMSTLIVELSDTQLHKLERLAQQRGTSIDVLVRAALDNLAAQSEYDITHDPLYTITAHETGAPADLSQHADHYLYGARKP
jgi:hypothetical protein